MYHFDFSVLVVWSHDLLQGILVTLEISALGVAGGISAGVVGGAIRALRLPVLNKAVLAYVEFMRNTPPPVQIFFLYFGLPQIGVLLPGFAVAVLSLITWGAAYSTENFRAGFEAVPQEYRQAARALAMSEWQLLLLVILPIGIRIAFPALGNTVISILKNSTYMLLISVPELTFMTMNILSITYRVIELILFMSVVYLGLVGLLSFGLGVVERRLAIPQTT